jgi:hypothetical protein
MVPKMFCLERFLYILSSSPLPLKLSKELFIFNLIYAREINQEKKQLLKKYLPIKGGGSYTWSTPKISEKKN